MMRIGLLSVLARTASLRPATPASRATSTRRAAAADPFAENRAPIVLYDGVCRMCNFWVDWVLDNDPTAKLRFAALQSPAGRRLLERSGRTLGGKAVTVARSMRTGKQAEHDDDGGGAVFDQLNNRLYPHDVPEAHLDFKKRKIMYPKDHDR